MITRGAYGTWQYSLHRASRMILISILIMISISVAMHVTVHDVFVTQRMNSTGMWQLIKVNLERNHSWESNGWDSN